MELILNQASTVTVHVAPHCVPHSLNHRTVASLDVHPSGKEFITAGHDGLARSWDAAFPSCCLKTVVLDSDHLTPLSALSSSIFVSFLFFIHCSPLCRSCVRYSPDARYVLVTSINNKHRLYNRLDFVDGVIIGSPSQHKALLPTAATTRTRQEIADDFNTRPLRTYCGHMNGKYSIQSCFHIKSNGSHILSGSEDGQVL